MKKTLLKNALLATLLTIPCCGPVVAQDYSAQNLYGQAEQAYRIGHVDKARELLLQNVGQFSGTVKQSAFRLLALCAFANDDYEEAEKYARELLRANPYYTPSLQDPQRFADLINRLKTERSATVTTASRQAETLEEAPVPVTLITEEMIRLSTARNLRELLADYVPGISLQEGQGDANIAMRGVLKGKPNHILIMRNGVRLNNHYDNGAPITFDVSLASIKQIEVLRGAASSLYGNAALTAVVNIITKDGADINGVRLSAGIGNEQTYKADIVVGKHMLETDLMAWATFYSSRGTRWDIDANSRLDNYFMEPTSGYIYTGGYNHKPTYELGMSFSWKDLTFYLSHQHCKHVTPYSGIMGGLYDYDNSKELEGYKPGSGTMATTASLKYGHTWRKFTLELDAAVSGEMIVDMADKITDHLVFDTVTLEPIKGGYKDTIKIQQKQNVMDVEIGVKGLWQYDFPRLGRGSLLAGIQADYVVWDKEVIFSALNSEQAYYNYSDIDITERTLSPFLQLKHSFSPRLILNAGLRFDFRDRVIGNKISKLSPRVALIYMPASLLSLRASYAYSFVDLTYSDRNMFKNGLEMWMDPHSTDNLQLSAILSFPDIHLKYEGNLYYQCVKGIRNIDYFYCSSNDKWIGLENVLDYSGERFKARLSASWHHMLDFKNIRRTQTITWLDMDKLLATSPNSSPALQATAQISQRLLPGLWLTAKGSFASKSTFCDFLINPNDPLWQKDKAYSIDLPANFLLDLSARYTWRNFELSLLCKNLLNHTYRLASDHALTLQQRRLLLATLTLNL